MKSTNEIGILLLGGKSVPYTVQRSAKRKRSVTIKVHEQDGVVILAPLRMPLKQLQYMAKRSEAWILDKYTAVEQNKIRQQQQQWVTGETIVYLGKQYKLQIIATDSPKTACAIVGDELRMMMPIGKQQSQLIKDRILAWYRQAAEQVVAERLQFWSELSGLKPVSWRITSAMRRWGSCSEKNRICINWRLIAVPLELLDYVVVHELCHLKHKDHAKLFWQLVAKWLPDYRNRKKALKMQVMDFI